MGRLRFYFFYSIVLLVVGVVLLFATGTAGLILIAGGVVGIVFSVRGLRR